ncbi:HAD-IIA family hydrolase [Arcticibacter eurypsychrophilus]|uniref:HAD-IIA family hydrolase n=1 Tax=Arcticibacter eurypsychrophilus TaxID=1434752 RepID=UPI00084CE95F|nr:HAD-IIA family hydrolase [Arcticibacter eurypsychrophilus]
MTYLSDFESIIEKYKVIFFDAYGVLRNYNGLFPGIERTFALLEARQKEYYIVTNDASRSPRQLASIYHQMGLPSISHHRIISSGMLAREYLDLKVHDGIVAYLGTSNSAHYIESSRLKTLPMSLIDESNIDLVNVLVFLDDEGFDWCSDLNKTVNLLRKRTIPVIVANADYAYPVNKNEVSIAIGGVASMIENILGREFINFGKPDSQLFMFAYDLVRKSSMATKNDILMVGDTLFTDILGGNKFGLDTVLVLSGNTLAADRDALIASTGIIPTYICESAVVG